MKQIKMPSSILQVARLYRPSVAEVKREVLRLAEASPTFSYQDLNLMIFDLLRGFASYEQVTRSINGIGYELKRNSYSRAIEPAWKYLSTLGHSYTLPIDPRSYSLSRDIRVPCIPPMLCGTEEGQVIPWLMLWKKNVLNEEQVTLFRSMAMDVLEQDGELEDASLLLIDTSDAALDADGMPTVIDCRSLERFSQEKLRDKLSTFVQGFNAAAQELQRKAQVPRRQSSSDRLDDGKQRPMDFGPDDSI